MQVLVKNPYTNNGISAKELSESFWSEDCLYPGAGFSLTSLMDLSDPVGLSPFLVLDPRIAFMLSQLNRGPAFCVGLGPLGAVGVALKTGGVSHQEDPSKFAQYVSEYLPRPVLSAQAPFDQVITFGKQTIDQDLWKKLKTGGFYLLGSISGPLKIEGVSFEAFGKLWPVGEPTEWGWKFNNEGSGLINFEFAKIKKLS